MTENSTPHDRFFKRFFGDLEVAKDFLSNYLPDEILSRLELDTLQLEKESFIDPELRNHFSDLLFTVRLKTTAVIYIYLLIEHKSSPEKWVAFQLLRYIVQFWERQQQSGCEKLPLILPIVFYHGEDRWTVSRRLSALIDSAGMESLLKFAPDFEYDLRDMSVRGGAEIKGQPKLRAGLSLLRYIFSDELAQRLPEAFRNLRAMRRPDALEFARSILAYLSRAGKKVKKEVVRKTMEQVFAEEEFDKSALFIQEWMEEGREEGREEGAHTSLVSIALLQLRYKLGELDEASAGQINALSNRLLEDLCIALIEFQSLADLQQWLDARAEKPLIH